MGLKNPMIATFPLSYLAIAQSAIKMILVLCDPLRRIEKIFWYWKPGETAMGFFIGDSFFVELKEIWEFKRLIFK